MNWTESRLNLLGFITKRNAPSAQVARERLQILLAHKPGADGSGEHSQLVAVLQEEILAVIARHMQIDRDKVVVKLDRAEDVSMLEIDIEMPPQAGDAPPRIRAQA